MVVYCVNAIEYGITNTSGQEHSPVGKAPEQYFQTAIDNGTKQVD